MKKINLLIFLLLISFLTFSQKTNKTQLELKEIILSIPDSALNVNIFMLPKAKRNALWELYEKGQYKKVESYVDLIFGNFEFMIRNDSINVNLLINKKDNLIRIAYPYSDAIPTYDIKMFQAEGYYLIAITLKYSDHATTNTKEIIFYKYMNDVFTDVTNEVLNSYNYVLDNYNDSTINILNRYYNCELRRDKLLNKRLLYTFTKYDTVIISESFFDISKGLELDEKYFDGEFFTKKYIMDNGKLRLAE